MHNKGRLKIALVVMRLYLVYAVIVN